jgi:hypothetical protein
MLSVVALEWTMVRKVGGEGTGIAQYLGGSAHATNASK